MNIKDQFPPILLTSSVIAMDSTVLLKKEALRVRFTLESIHEWLKILPSAKLVICDGSGYDFSPLIKKSFPNAQIECISFVNDRAMIEAYGKGYGEGEIIKYALRHSKYLLESSWFAKCTAKLWVKNFKTIVKCWNGTILVKPYFSNVFSTRLTELKYIDTRFYLINTELYKKLLLNSHYELGDPDGGGIEKIFLDKIKRIDCSRCFFSIPPIIAGVGGGSGKYYNVSKVRCIKEYLRFYLASKEKKYSNYFVK